MSVVPPKHVSPLPLCLLGLFAGGWKGETAADVLLLQSIFGKPSPASFGRIWIQLDEFCKATRPFSPTLAKFPALFWILPKPFETDIRRGLFGATCLKSAACFFPSSKTEESRSLKAQ